MKRLVLIVVLLALACGPRGADAPGRDVVALIDGEPVLQTELDLYFRVNLLEPLEPVSELMEGSPGADDLNRVKSRLFDEFLGEQALLIEARRRDIRVSDTEIEAYIDLGRVEGTGVTDLTPESRTRLAQKRLLIQKLHESIAAGITPPTDEEVAGFAEENEWLPETGKSVLVRVLLLDTLETAQEVHSDIRRNRTTFADAVLEHESQPGQAAPQTLDWNSLPEQVREALERLKPGQVSAPLDHNGLIYLFQVQAWLEDDGWSQRERLRAAREALVREKGLEAAFALMNELKESSEIRLLNQHLGFEYVPSTGS